MDGWHGPKCSPNCGQVVIQNQGGSVVININCCPGGSPVSFAEEDEE